MKKIYSIVTLFSLLTLLVFVTVPVFSQTTIVDIAVSDTENFSTLVAAVTAADLVETLSGPGPFTVFAPTNDAFAALPEGILDYLLSDIPALTDVLLYHVSSDELMSDDLADAGSITTLQGGSLVVSTGGRINNAEILVADIQASNGIIHVIDQVLIPPPVFDPTNDATVTILSSTGGSTNPTTGTYVYSDGTTITLTATPNDGFEFLYWIVSGDFTPGTEIREPNVIIDGEFVFVPPVEFTGSDSLIFTNNPASITCGFGYTYRYQAIFAPVLAGQDPPSPIFIIGEDVNDPLDSYNDLPRSSEVSFVGITATIGGTTSPVPGRYAFPTAEPNFELTAIPDQGYQFDSWVITGDYMPGHGGDPSLDTNVIDMNPLPVSHGMGYTYNYEAVFSLIDEGESNGDGNGNGDASDHPFGLTNELLYALLIILAIVAVIGVLFGLYTYRKKK